MTERILQFGTGMLLRAISATAVDAARRSGRYDGTIVIVQSTPGGVGAAMNSQHGRFTLVERGLVHGTAVQRVRIIDAISRVLVADTDWAAIRRVAATPELRVIVSNVTEAAFRLEDDPIGVTPPIGFPARLTNLLHARHEALADAPILFVIPTELVPDNGPRLAAMVDTLAREFADADTFRAWIATHVRFCSSLVDRITTGSPSGELSAEIEAETGFHDTLITVTEPHSLWAIEGDADALREALPVDTPSDGTVIFASDIAPYRERKLRLLNGAHTALAPLAIQAGLRTVRELMAHPELGPFLRELLRDEIGPSTDLRPADASAYIDSVLDRFANPWLDHEWSVIATNQTTKLRLRVVPSVVAFVARFDLLPARLVHSLAASLRYARAVRRVSNSEGEGWWRGSSYRIVDVDFGLIDRHWLSVDARPGPAVVPDTTLGQFAKSVLGDKDLWGCNLAAIPGMTTAVARALGELE